MDMITNGLYIKCPFVTMDDWVVYVTGANVEYCLDDLQQLTTEVDTQISYKASEPEPCT